MSQKLTKKGKLDMAIGNHKMAYRQVFGCGQQLDDYEKANESMRSPTPGEYNALPPEIKAQYANYAAYKTFVDNNNHTTRLAMKDKLIGSKANYMSYTNGSASDKTKFDEEADELIAELGV